MGLSSIGSGALNMAQSQAQWDAIVSIKSVSPFTADGGDSTATVASGFDAMLSGYNAQAQMLQAATAGQDDSTSALFKQLSAAQQSTIDLFA